MPEKTGYKINVVLITLLHGFGKISLIIHPVKVLPVMPAKMAKYWG